MKTAMTMPLVASYSKPIAAIAVRMRRIPIATVGNAEFVDGTNQAWIDVIERFADQIERICNEAEGGNCAAVPHPGVRAQGLGDRPQ